MSSDDSAAADRAYSRRRPTRAALAWLAVILLIGVVQLGRGQWADAALFGAAAAVVLVSALSEPVRSRWGPRPALLPVAVGAVVPAAVLSVTPRHSLWAGVTVAAVGVAAAALAWAPSGRGGSGGGWTPALRRLAWSWAIIVIVAALWELLQVTLGRILPGGRASYPALSDLLDPLVSPPVGQTLFALGWIALGVFLTRRGRRR